jgi:HK97 family phage portal protein
MRNPFKRNKTEDRSIVDFPWNYGLASPQTVSQERALSLIPVYAANRLIAGTVSTLPLKAYRRAGEDRVPATMPVLFRDLEDEGRLVPWLHQAIASLGLRGNAYGYIVSRDGFGYPTRIEWLNPSEVSVDPTIPAVPGWFWRGRRVEREDVLHIPLFTLPGETLGLSPIGAFASTINTGIAASRYGADWFDNGGFPPGTFQNTAQTVNQDQAEAIKARLAQAIRSRQPLVYGSDWDYKSVAVPPGEAQFIETMRMNATQVAAIYDVPPERIGGETGKSMTYQNVEQQQINFVMALRPWMVILEHAFASVLPNRQYVKFNADAMIRADVKTRYDVYEISRKIGLRSVDELRALEELPPLPNGEGADYTPSGANLTPPGLPTSGSAVPGQGDRMIWRVPS